MGTLADVVNEFNDMEMEINRLREQVSYLRGRMDYSAQKGKDAKIAQLTEELQVAEHNHTTMKGLYRKADTDRSNLQWRVTQLEEQMASKEQHIGDLMANIGQLEEELEGPET